MDSKSSPAAPKVPGMAEVSLWGIRTCWGIPQPTSSPGRTWGRRSELVLFQATRDVHFHLANAYLRPGVPTRSSWSWPGIDRSLRALGHDNVWAGGAGRALRIPDRRRRGRVGSPLRPHPSEPEGARDGAGKDAGTCGYGVQLTKAWPLDMMLLGQIEFPGAVCFDVNAVCRARSSSGDGVLGKPVTAP